MGHVPQLVKQVFFFFPSDFSPGSLAVILSSRKMLGFLLKLSLFLPLLYPRMSSTCMV